MSSRSRPPVLLPATTALLLSCSLAGAQQAELPPESERSTQPAAGTTEASKPASRAEAFLRLQRKDGQPTALQTAVVQYARRTNDEDQKPLTVDLVAAVHVGDAAYYDSLNQLFSEYDVVLYELVAPKGMRPVPGEQRSGNPVSFLQNSMKSALNLESQTERVDYRKPNFVHADMTPAQISERMKQRGETGMTVALNVLSDVLRQANQQPQAPVAEVDMMALLFDDNSDQKLKVMMAEQFVAQGTLDKGLGQTLNRMLIQDRNETAMKVLAEQLRKGHRRVAIYYGAAHMPDFEKRLVADHDMQLAGTRWLTAWDLTRTRPAKKKEPKADPVRRLLKLLDKGSQ